MIRSDDKISNLNSQIDQRQNEIHRLNTQINSTVNEKEIEIVQLKTTLDQVNTNYETITNEYKIIQKQFDEKKMKFFNLILLSMK